MSIPQGRVPRHRWMAVAAAMSERMSHVGLDQAGLAEAAGLSAQVIRDLQNGVPKDYRSTTLVRVARALEWPVDAFPRLLSGLPAAGGAAERGVPAGASESTRGVSHLESQVDDLERSLADLRRQLGEIQRKA